MLLLFHPNQFGGVVASFLKVLDNLALHIGLQLWCTAKYPKVFGATAAYDRVGIVGREVEDVIIAIEGTKETDAQLSWLAVLVGLGFTCALLELAVEGVEMTAVEYLNHTIVEQCVLSGSTYKITLESMVVAGYFVPFTQITVEVKRSDSAVVYLLRMNCHTEYTKKAGENTYFHKIYIYG